MKRRGPKDWNPGERFTKKEGWVELPEVNAAVQDRSLDIKALWRAVAQMDLEHAQIVILEAGYDLLGSIEDVRLVAIPDDRLGEFYRLWVRYS